ncbi:MAG: DUF4345 domain-containing protein [Planctomycetota bacterium]
MQKQLPTLVIAASGKTGRRPPIDHSHRTHDHITTPHPNLAVQRITKTQRILLVVSGLIAAGIGASILATPAQFHATHGIDLAGDPSLLSEVRAPGGALAVLGGMMLIGAFVRSFTTASLAIATAVYLAYGASRLVGFGLDGMPHPGLVQAAVAELVIGAVCAVALVRAVSRGNSAGIRAAAEPVHALEVA